MVYVNRHFFSAIEYIIDYTISEACFGSNIVLKCFPKCLEISYVGTHMSDRLISSIFTDENYEKSQKMIPYGAGKEPWLYAAKKIIEANGSFLSIRSEPMYDRNIFAELLIANYLNSLSEKECYNFIHKDIENSLFPFAEGIYERIKNIQEMSYDQDYLNTDLSLSEYQQNYHYAFQSLVHFESVYLCDSISKTNITIYYGR